MVKCEVIGFKRIEKPGRVFYHISAISEENTSSGLTAYTGLISAEHLKKHQITEEALLGAKCKYFSIKNGNTYRGGFTFKK